MLYNPLAHGCLYNFVSWLANHMINHVFTVKQWDFPELTGRGMHVQQQRILFTLFLIGLGLFHLDDPPAMFYFFTGPLGH